MHRFSVTHVVTNFNIGNKVPLHVLRERRYWEYAKYCTLSSAVEIEVNSFSKRTVIIHYLSKILGQRVANTYIVCLSVILLSFGGIVGGTSLSFETEAFFCFTSGTMASFVTRLFDGIVIIS